MDPHAGRPSGTGIRSRLPLGAFRRPGTGARHDGIPIQKHTMDERVIADTYGKDIAIWAGFDVQQTIPWGTPGDVRREVRFMLDTYARPEGRLLFTAGNGINQDCSLDSLEALYDEAYAYGSETVRKMRAGESVNW